MGTKPKAGDALEIFCKEFGVPDIIRMDGSKDKTDKNNRFQAEARKHGIDANVSEANTNDQILEEGVVQEVNHRSYWIMFKERFPLGFMVLWNVISL